MYRKSAKKLVKRGLSLSRIKILYSRITLTRFTTAYFYLAFFACIAMTVIQILTYVENSEAVNVLEPVHDMPDMGIVLVEDDKLYACKSLPTSSLDDCMVVAIYGSGAGSKGAGNQTARRSSDSIARRQTNAIDLSDLTQQCVLSLKWLDDLLHDAKREDIVNMAFNIWVFVLALTTVVNESIPHLIASLLGHVLGTAWAAYRVHSTRSLMMRYKNYIVPQTCNGVDLLQGWWDYRIQRAIPYVVINCITLVGAAYLSFRLFRVYAKETFSRVGASPQIHRMYKVALVFLVCLQLSGFFSLASTALWLDKICHGAIQRFSVHHELYLAAFIVTLVMQIPWFILGWTCVRNECKIRFFVFMAIAVLLLGVSTAMFFSPLYRYIFVTWPFFTTVTCTAYLLVLSTTVLSFVCLFNFGKGLAHYFQVKEALEGVDFTPVFFPKDGDVEKPTQSADSKAGYVDFPPPAYQSDFNRKSKADSIYSQNSGPPIQLFAAKPLMSDLGAAPERLTSTATARNRLSKPPPKRSESLGRRSRAFEPPDAPEFIVAAPGPPRVPPVVIIPSTPDDRSPVLPPGIEVLAYIPVSPKKTPQLKASRTNGLPANPRGRK